MGTAHLGGLNALSGLAVLPIRDPGHDSCAEETDRDVRLLDILDDLEAVIRYVKKHRVSLSGDSLDALRELAARLLAAVQ